MRNRLESSSTVTPRDKYETCLRELDELKISIDQKEEIEKERDLYKYFYDEIRELALSPNYSAQQVQDSLRALFKELDGKVAKNNWFFICFYWFDYNRHEKENIPGKQVSLLLIRQLFEAIQKRSWALLHWVDSEQSTSASNSLIHGFRVGGANWTGYWIGKNNN